MNKGLLLIAVMLLSITTLTAGIYNNGAKIVVTSGAHLVIMGNLQNETASASTGTIQNDGTVSISGDITNNSTGSTLFSPINTTGTLEFSATGTQNVTGTAGVPIQLEYVTVASDANVVFSGIGAVVNQDIALGGSATNLSVGSEDISVLGAITGSGLVKATGAGFLSMTPQGTTPLVYPVSDGTYDYSTTITSPTTPSSPIKVKIHDNANASRALTVDLWNIQGDADLDATIKLRVPKASITSRYLPQNMILRRKVGSDFVIVPNANFSVVEFGNYYEITIIHVNQF